MKNKHIVLLALFLLTACKEASSDKYKPVPISEIRVPEKAKKGDAFVVYVKTKAPNGCWNNIKVHLKSSGYYYILYAEGKYAGDSICPDVAVETESEFPVTLFNTGKYYFQANESPLELKYDTVEVVN